MTNLITILLILSLSVPAFSQDRALVLHEGKEGYWFSVEKGDKLLNDVIELPNLKAQNLELVGKLVLKNEALVLKDLAIDTEKKIGTHWKEAYVEENTLRIKENTLHEKKLNAKTPWYKRPGVVFFGGTLVGAALAVGVAFGINWATTKEF